MIEDYGCSYDLEDFWYSDLLIGKALLISLPMITRLNLRKEYYDLVHRQSRYKFKQGWIFYCLRDFCSDLHIKFPEQVANYICTTKDFGEFSG